LAQLFSAPVHTASENNLLKKNHIGTIWNSAWQIRKDMGSDPTNNIKTTVKQIEINFTLTSKLQLEPICLLAAFILPYYTFRFSLAEYLITFAYVPHPSHLHHKKNVKQLHYNMLETNNHFNLPALLWEKDSDTQDEFPGAFDSIMLQTGCETYPENTL
jgi:hypothetical protein